MFGDHELCASTKTIKPVFDENTEVVVFVCRHNAISRDRLDIGFRYILVIGMERFVQFKLILGERKQVREHAVFRVPFCLAYRLHFCFRFRRSLCFARDLLCHDALLQHTSNLYHS